MSICPIAFFAFNRPQHTVQALDALRNNTIAAGTPIYLFCDGERSPEEAQDVAQVRRALTSLEWPGPVHQRFRSRNAGLKTSLLEGITEVLSEHDRIIVVEDDVIASPGFVDFLKGGLDLYEGDPQVMHLSAYSPIDPPADYDAKSFVLNHTYVGWGWATWRRAWERLSTDGEELRRQTRARGCRHYLNLDGTYEFYWALRALDEGRSQDWNAYWHSSVILNDGVCVHPVHSLADNIGFDGSGTQCTDDPQGMLRPVVERLPIERIPLAEDKRLRHLALAGRGHRWEIRLKHWARIARDMIRRPNQPSQRP